MVSGSPSFQPRPGRARYPLLLTIGALGAAAPSPAAVPPAYALEPRAIRVDGDPADWAGVRVNRVAGEKHLWFGQAMTRENWRGDRDLSYQWRGAWSGQRLFFLVEVHDDRVVAAGQPASYLCDCVEIYLDFLNRGGARVTVADGRADWFDKCLPGELRGYELHLLPSSPPRVFLDHRDKYATDKPQTQEFRRAWAGEVATARTKTGYLIEVGFAVPSLPLRPDLVLGVEVGVCDDDGAGRKSIMMWTGTKRDFWLNMDGYGKVRLAPPAAAK